MHFASALKDLLHSRVFEAEDLADFNSLKSPGKGNSRLETCSEPGAMNAPKPFHPKESIHPNLFGNAMKEARGPFCYVRTYVRKCVLHRTRVEPFHLRTYPFTYLAFSSSWARAGRGARGPGFRGIRVEPFHPPHFPRIVSGLGTSGIWSSQHLLRTFTPQCFTPGPRNRGLSA